MAEQGDEALCHHGRPIACLECVAEEGQGDAHADIEAADFVRASRLAEVERERDEARAQLTDATDLATLRLRDNVALQSQRDEATAKLEAVVDFFNGDINRDAALVLSGQLQTLASTRVAPAAATPEPGKYCCHACWAEFWRSTKRPQALLDRMIVCPICGNKRCPKASNHELACTGSNASGQPGSVFAATPEPPVVELSGDAPLSAYQRLAAIDGATAEPAHNPSEEPCGYLITDGQATIGACQMPGGHECEHMRCGNPCPLLGDRCVECLALSLIEPPKPQGGDGPSRDLERRLIEALRECDPCCCGSLAAVADRLEGKR